jgi:hypothetical protein
VRDGDRSRSGRELGFPERDALMNASPRNPAPVRLPAWAAMPRLGPNWPRSGPRSLTATTSQHRLPPPCSLPLQPPPASTTNAPSRR